MLSFKIKKKAMILGSVALLMVTNTACSISGRDSSNNGNNAGNNSRIDMSNSGNNSRADGSGAYDPNGAVDADGNYIADYMYTQYDVKTEFIVLRVEDNYMNISTNRETVYMNDDIDLSGLKDGQFAYVKATVDIYNGGEAGFLDNYWITDLKSVEVIDFAEGIELGGIASIEEKTFANREFLLKYEQPEGLYLIASNYCNMEVYLNGEFIYEYDSTGMSVDELTEAFYDNMDAMRALSFKEYSYVYNDNDNIIEKLEAAEVFFTETDGIESLYFKEIAMGSSNGRVPGPTDYYYVGVAKISDKLAADIQAKYELEPVTVEYDRNMLRYVEDKVPQWETCDDFTKDYLKKYPNGKLFLNGNDLYFEIFD